MNKVVKIGPNLIFGASDRTLSLSKMASRFYMLLMNQKVYFFAAGIALLSACSTPTDLRKKIPSLEAASLKGSKAVAGCIADKWEAGGNRPTLTTRPTTHGYALAAENDLGVYGKDTGFVVDVDDNSAGSSTRFYSNMARASGVELVSSIVKACQ